MLTKKFTFLFILLPTVACPVSKKQGGAHMDLPEHVDANLTELSCEKVVSQTFVLRQTTPNHVEVTLFNHCLHCLSHSWQQIADAWMVLENCLHYINMPENSCTCKISQRSQWGLAKIKIGWFAVSWWKKKVGKLKLFSFFFLKFWLLLNVN